MLLISFLVPLSATILLELCVALLFWYKKKSLFLSIVFVNCITNLTLNYVLWVNNSFAFFTPTFSTLLVLEVLVVVVEWILLKYVMRESTIRLFLLVLIMNIVSCVAGFILFL